MGAVFCKSIDNLKYPLGLLQNYSLPSGEILTLNTSSNIYEIMSNACYKIINDKFNS